jgi:hypothetical protein
VGKRSAIVDHCEKRLLSEVELGYKCGLAEGAAKARSVTFTPYKKTGMFKLRTQQLYRNCAALTDPDIDAASAYAAS